MNKIFKFIIVGPEGKLSFYSLANQLNYFGRESAQTGFKNVPGTDGRVKVSFFQNDFLKKTTRKFDELLP